MQIGHQLTRCCKNGRREEQGENIVRGSMSRGEMSYTRLQHIPSSLAGLSEAEKRHKNERKKKKKMERNKRS